MHKEEAQCQICKQHFVNRDLLKEHYKNKHDPYNCNYCNKSFTLLRYLKMHEKLHKNESIAKLVCCYCQKSFSHRALANHIFKYHHENFNEWRDKNLDLIK